MVRNFRKESVFRVGGAILFGVLLVGGALFVQRNAAARAAMRRAPAAVIARGDVRAMRPATDSDKDGLPDWEEHLRGTDPHTRTVIETPTATPTNAEPYEKPTTLTGQFAEQFLENILRNGAGKTMTEEEKTKVVNDSIIELSANIRDKQYTQADIRSVAQNDLAAFREYGNTLADLFLTPSAKNEPELAILDRALQANDPELLAPLRPIEEAYGRMVSGILDIQTPSALAGRHVDLLNTLSLIQADIAAMRQVFSDPLGSLVRIRRYKNDGQALPRALDDIRTALETQGVVYTSGESGLILFSLRP